MSDLPVEAAIGVSYTVELPGKKGIVFQTHVPQAIAAGDFNVVLDKMKTAADRQYAFGMVEILKMELEQQEKLAADHSQRMADLDAKIKSDWAGKRGDPKLSVREQDEQRKAHFHAEECKRRVAKVKTDLGEYQRIVSGA